MNVNYCSSKLNNWGIFGKKVSIKNVSGRYTISAKSVIGLGNLYYM